MTVEIISWSISTKVWDRAEIELATPGSVARHVTDCPTRSGNASIDRASRHKAFSSRFKHWKCRLNHKIGQHLVRQPNAIWMAFRWRTDSGRRSWYYKTQRMEWSLSFNKFHRNIISKSVKPFWFISPGLNIFGCYQLFQKRFFRNIFRVSISLDLNQVPHFVGFKGKKLKSMSVMNNTKAF